MDEATRRAALLELRAAYARYDLWRRVLGLPEPGETVWWAMDARGGLVEGEVVADGQGRYRAATYLGRNPDDRMGRECGLFGDEAEAIAKVKHWLGIDDDDAEDGPAGEGGTDADLCG